MEQMLVRNRETGEITKARIKCGYFQLWNRVLDSWVDCCDLYYLGKKWELYTPMTVNYAQKDVEKLNAWKRLRHKGFRFERWLIGGEYGNTITFSFDGKCDDETRADLDLLFGGED